MLMPMLSEADPRDSAEGSIDPLGMYAIADSMAVQMIPGVRERQQHPRFLTTVALSLSLCQDFGEDIVAVDGVSEPWQVFEWHYVQGMVLRTKDRSQLRGLPGQDKARRAIRDKLPLSAKRYLKTPGTFGFHGIYRALAKDVEIEQADRLGDVGRELLSVWESEQHLRGIRGNSDGPGAAVRSKLKSAIEDALKAGAVKRKPGWPEWQFFPLHLGIYGASVDEGNGGPSRESQVIVQAIRKATSGFRREVWDALVSEQGRAIWSEEAQAKRPSERRFHSFLLSRASAALQELLRAIDAYERFSRYLQDAFDDCLYCMSKFQNRTKPSELADLVGVRAAAQAVPEMFAEVAERLPSSLRTRLHDNFHDLAERASSEEWVVQLLEHHRRIQRSKPPAGKAPWFDRYDDGTYMIRTAYLRDRGGRHDDHYVHAYRTLSFWSFAYDLGIVG